jgi:chromosome segregation ATPase
MLAAGLLALSVGAATASGGYRHRLLRDRLQLAEAAIQGRDAELAGLRAAVAAQRGFLSAVQTDADSAKAALRAAQRRLSGATEDLRSSEQIVAAQRAEIEALQACLVGTQSALRSMAAGSRYGALHYLVAVDKACRVAQILLTVQTRR